MMSGNLKNNRGMNEFQVSVDSNARSMGNWRTRMRVSSKTAIAPYGFFVTQGKQCSEVGVCGNNDSIFSGSSIEDDVVL
jgi:hypothetical protein